MIVQLFDCQFETINYTSDIEINHLLKCNEDEDGSNEEVDEITIQFNNIAICKEVQLSNMYEAKIDPLAVEKVTLAEDIDIYIKVIVIALTAMESVKLKNLKN